MNREEFLRQLECLLSNIPESDKMDAMAYYNDYFDDAGIENENYVIQELGSPEKVAEKIKEDLHMTDYEDPSNTTKPQVYGQSNSTASNLQPEKKKTPWALIIIILILTFPLWIGIVAGLFGVLIGLIGGLFGVLCGLFGAGIGLTLGGLGCIIGGIFTFSPVEAILSAGIGFILTAVGLLLLLLFVRITFQWIPALCKALFRWCKRLFNKEDGGNEI